MHRKCDFQGPFSFPPETHSGNLGLHPWWKTTPLSPAQSFVPIPVPVFLVILWWLVTYRICITNVPGKTWRAKGGTMQTTDKMHLEKCLAMGLYLIITGNQPLCNSLTTRKKTRNESTIPGTQPVSKDQILYFYDTSTFQNSRNMFSSFYFRFWPAPDKGKTCQRRTDKQEIGWEGDINASANEQSYKDLDCTVPGEKETQSYAKVN